MAKNLRCFLCDPLVYPLGPGRKEWREDTLLKPKSRGLVGKRVKRDDVIGEVKGYEYIADVEEEDEQYHAYSLFILWDRAQPRSLTKPLIDRE